MSIKRDDPKRRQKKAFFDRMKPILAKVKGNKKLSNIQCIGLALRSWKLGTKI